MHSHHRYKVGVAGLVVVIEEWPVLVVVGVEVFLRQLLVRLNKIVKHLDL